MWPTLVHYLRASMLSIEALFAAVLKSKRIGEWA